MKSKNSYSSCIEKEKSIITFPKNRPGIGKKCSGHIFSKYHLKLLHFNLSRICNLELTSIFLFDFAASKMSEK